MVSGSAVVSGEFCVVAEGLTSNDPSIGVSGLPISGHSYTYKFVQWFHDTGYDYMIRAYADPLGVPVGGVVMPANTFTIVVPWLAVIGLVGCIGTVVVIAKKHEK